MSWRYKSAAMVVTLLEAKHMNVLVTKAYMHFYADIPERTDRLVPTQWFNNYGHEAAVGQMCDARPSWQKTNIPVLFPT